jgi:serine/threonine protein kinase
MSITTGLLPSIYRVLDEFFENPASIDSLRSFVFSLSEIPGNLGLDQNAFLNELQALLQAFYTKIFPPRFVSTVLNSVKTKDPRNCLKPNIVRAINLLRPSWKEKMKASELIRIKLLNPKFSKKAKSKKSNTSSSAQNVYKAPFKVMRWDNFIPECLAWLPNQDFEFVVDVPMQVKRKISEAPWWLQTFIRDNLLNFVTPCLKPKAKFTGGTNHDSVEGKPDLLMVRDGKIVAPVQVTWTIRKPDIVGIYLKGKDESLISAVNQLYHYMRLNFKQYGVLTSYQITCFFRREIENGKDVLYISEGFKYNREEPTIQECFAYFNSRVSKNAFKSPTTSVQGIDETVEVSVSESIFDVSTALGQGRSNVFLVPYKGEQIALKRGDAGDANILAEFKNEVNVYKVLKDLQGKCIPELLFAQTVDDLFVCLGLSLCGSKPKVAIIRKKKKELKKIFKQIHSRNVTHNDIKLENILVKDGNLFVIDFGFAKINSVNYEIGDEEMNLGDFLKSL